MGEIKFRAWDERNKSYIYSGFGEKTFTIFVKRVNIPRYKIEQYTGLKDKNGVEIYERDIIRTTPKGPYIASSNGCSLLIRIITWLEEEAEFGWQLTNGVIEQSGYTLCKNNAENIFEVIGNIHENPELLESK